MAELHSVKHWLGRVFLAKMALVHDVDFNDICTDCSSTKHHYELLSLFVGWFVYLCVWMVGELTGGFQFHILVLLNFSSQMNQSDAKQITATKFSARSPSITPTTLTWYLSMVLIDQPTPPRHLSVKPRFHLPFCLMPLSDRPWLHEMCSDSGLSVSE